MTIELQIEYILLLGVALLSGGIGAALVLLAQRFLNKETQVEATTEEIAVESIEETAQESTTESTETATTETVVETASEETVEKTSEGLFEPFPSEETQKVDFDSFLNTQYTTPEYNTEIYQKIADDYNRMLEKIREKEQQAQQENTVPSGTGFARQLPGKASQRRVRRVEGKVRFTGSVESPNPGEFSNQVFPNE